jgi:hypothetical protein
LFRAIGTLGRLARLSAVAQSIGEKTGANSVLCVSPTTQDFVKEAAISDMLEIAAAKIAQDKGNAEEKSSRRKWSLTTLRPVPTSRVLSVAAM